MTRGASDLKFKDYEKLCHWLARRLVTGAAHLGAAYEDVFQEVAMQWCRCRDNYDPESGVKFATYFARSVMPQRRDVERRIFGRHHAITGSLDEEVTVGEGDGLSLWDVTADPRAENPEAEMMRREAIVGECERNPLLARLIGLSAEPTEEIKAHLRALQARKEWAKEMGVEVDVPDQVVTLGGLRRLFGLNWRQKPLAQPVCGMIEEMP